ncbi:cbb3-type cytochrome oxidase assembly protein CcoS [Sulfitobacter geojensis]|uniref:cbb3-type cytochrome oxidase assembly protein CcoS n=1 Tax=Sulfitobacter geojensis TaxID=1342299 RepID=UPI000469D64C|nr:cbb3-type cytochrome oxidase assembly protein CcoS [Sulfitobacter geojensis]KHA51930.1 CcoS domain containing protein [Sulfitobacter geojensis]NYI29337.1 cbb3-type cytochrome oxidase maturation protein [Sulfitobacter geojensis]
MNILAILIPVSLTLGGLGLLAFLWSLRSDQYDDLDGAAWRILLDDETPPVDVDQRPETDHPSGS